MKIGIIGTGMFGFALARYLGKKYLGNDQITIMTYDRSAELIEHLRRYRTHLYHFKNKKLPPNVSFTTNKKELIDNADIVIMAVPSQDVRGVIKEIREHLKAGVTILNTAKALEIKTAKTLSEVVNEEMTDTPNYTIAKLSGGTFAEDLVNEVPLGADVACENVTILKELQNIFHSEKMRIYGTTDLTGVEYAGAFKNVIAILAGIINGLGLPYGSETHMISRAAKEAKEIAVGLGAKPQTFSMESQCWGNDLWMSCTGKSRNREFGRLIGSGLTPEEALKKMGEKRKLVEGYYTALAIPKLCKNAKVSMPIFNEIYKIVCENKEPFDSIKLLMNRGTEYIGEL